MDTSRRNNLLYFRPLKLGTLDCGGYCPEQFGGLLSGESILLSKLLPDGNHTQAAACLKEIRKRADANREEKGLQTLFLAIGMASWPPADGGRPPEAAVILLPIEIHTKGREGRSISIARAGDPQFNLTLAHTLDAELGCKVSIEQIMETTHEFDTAAKISEVYDYLRAATQSVSGFQIKDGAVIGNFSFQKMAMVRDLQESSAALADHDIIASLAGDNAAREAIRGIRKDVDARQLDSVPPEKEFLFRDADSSQQRVICSVLAGNTGVIQGPPGTGKSQTIANIIGTLAAHGKRVLFVAEKRAALEVVYERLKQAGLAHLTIDLHGADVSLKSVMQRIASALTSVREAAPVVVGDVHTRLADRRAKLNTHVSKIHARRPPSNLSIYDLQGRILCMLESSKSSIRWRGSALAVLDGKTSQHLIDLLLELGSLEAVFRRTDSSPWIGLTLADKLAAKRNYELASTIASERLPQLQAAIRGIVAMSTKAPTTLTEVDESISICTLVSQTLGAYDEAIFDFNLTEATSELAPAGNGVLSLLAAFLFNSRFRKARQTILGLRRPGTAPAAQLLAEMRDAAQRFERWRTRFNSRLAVVPDLERVHESASFLSKDLETFGNETGLKELKSQPLARLESHFSALAADPTTPYRVARASEIERELEGYCGKQFLSELRSRDSKAWKDVFTYCLFQSYMDDARASEPDIATFNGTRHDGFVSEFKSCDRERIKLAPLRITRAHALRVVSTMNQYTEQAALVRREAEKRSRHIPLRKLLAAAPDVLTALCQCWMASPLSVSQLFDAKRRYFDVVLFDEASQVLPEDAVPALLRANHVVVAGDKHQLPPTTFFADGAGMETETGDDEDSATSGFESILDHMSAFVEPWPLEWHYRSRDETLIAFSNRHIYRDGLVTFPGPGGPACVSHELVEWEAGRDGQEESASAEVERVVALILDHAANRPDESLGVIAMGLPHARRIEALLERQLAERDDLSDFFDENRPERFFVKNLERVQGDERDAIILTIGYGKDRAGNLPFRFGPLLHDGGERRLNVAITRARNRLTLVSSFSHNDMDPAKCKKRGTELLRLYLQYAASNGKLLGELAHSSVPMNSFEADIHDALTSRQIKLLPQWGASRYRIDLVAQHPIKPGRLVLAIECDGASYHSAPTARDRDRLRQQQLEALGWRFHRIWSQDWFTQRSREIDRAAAAFASAVEYADKLDLGVAKRPQQATSQSVQQPPKPIIERGPLPKISKYDDIDQYADRDLVALVRWVVSDSRIRMDDEIVSELVKVMGFSRRGPRIVARLQDAINQVRRSRLT